MIQKTWLPQALLIGVEYGLFWSLNPKKLEPFIEVFKQKQLHFRDEVNFGAWLNGVYVANAISACFGKNGQYPSEPIRFEKGDEEQTASVEAQKFGAFAVVFNEGFE